MHIKSGRARVRLTLKAVLLPATQKDDNHSKSSNVAKLETQSHHFKWILNQFLNTMPIRFTPYTHKGHALRRLKSNFRKENEAGVNRCKLLPLEWISNEILLPSTENYIPCDGTWWRIMCKKKCIYIYVCVYDWVTAVQQTLTEHCKSSIMEKIKIILKKENEEQETKISKPLKQLRTQATCCTNHCAVRFCSAYLHPVSAAVQLNRFPTVRACQSPLEQK